jgi:hypothetical protein
MPQPVVASLAIAALALLAAAGCGGGPSFSGDVDVPDGYTTYRGDGVSFVHPRSWRPVTRDLGHGITEIRFQATGGGRTAPAVVLTVQPGVGARFDTKVDGQRQVLETVGDAKVEQDTVEVPGARKAYLSHVEIPDRGQGASRSQSVDVLAPDGRQLTLSAGAPKRDADAIDTEAVIASLRLG